jgi:quinoprotein glucose dehydrogenase
MQEWCRQKIESLRSQGPFTPPSIGGSVEFPGNLGGVNWGSAAWYPKRNLLLANTNRVAAIVKLLPRDDIPNALARDKATVTAWGAEFGRQSGTPFGMYREWLVAPNGQPCNAPPWGALVAFDLNSGRVRWESPLGVMGDGWPPGSLNFGGPLATAGGLIFTGGALDPHLRAFDVDTGRELWSTELPASAQSTPMTYEWRGKQYIVISAGGHGHAKNKLGDAVVAFALQ